MEYQNNQPGSRYRDPAFKPNSFAQASLILGILSIVTAFLGTVYPPFILASLAVLLAVLSKGASRHMSGSAKGGFVLAFVGIAANLAVVGTTLYLFATVPQMREQLHEQLNQTSELFYGQDFDSLLEESGYGFLLD